MVKIDGICKFKTCKSKCTIIKERKLRCVYFCSDYFRFLRRISFNWGQSLQVLFWQSWGHSVHAKQQNAPELANEFMIFSLKLLFFFHFDLTLESPLGKLSEEIEPNWERSEKQEEMFGPTLWNILYEDVL